MSFGAIADDYDRLRPTPPDPAVQWLVPANCRVAVDLAAGTGLLARRLGHLAGRVVAVEPDPRMAAVLRARSPGVQVVQGKGEAIPLASGSVDGVFISSAWHWLDPDQAVPEIGRLLRDGGRFGVIWTSRDRDVDWVAELGQPPEPGTAAERSRPWRREVVPNSDLFGVVQAAQFTFSRTMATSDVVAMMGTYSGLITASPADRADRLDRIRALLAERFPAATEIGVPMRSWCYRVERSDRP
jgi:SAM-dependent methyltransferase